MLSCLGVRSSQLKLGETKSRFKKMEESWNLEKKLGEKKSGLYREDEGGESNRIRRKGGERSFRESRGRTACFRRNLRRNRLTETLRTLWANCESTADPRISPLLRRRFQSKRRERKLSWFPPLALLLALSCGVFSSDFTFAGFYGFFSFTGEWLVGGSIGFMGFSFLFSSFFLLFW